ncbi:hypothetical protein [Sporosarcina sp. OR05]|uniref:DUF7662 domain-containing protein n=1 Tax=Sporosarcina sp. OR05 TaxID=2969819 RepID=UPI00352A8858
MAKGDSYIGLKKLLVNSREKKVVFSFQEIEEIIGRKLPKSAYKHTAWWSNNYDHSQAIAWIDAGYETYDVTANFGKEKITFIKIVQ